MFKPLFIVLYCRLAVLARLLLRETIVNRLYSNTVATRRVGKGC